MTLIDVSGTGPHGFNIRESGISYLKVLVEYHKVVDYSRFADLKHRGYLTWYRAGTTSLGDSSDPEQAERGAAVHDVT